jgi:hypothetical protein
LRASQKGALGAWTSEKQGRARRLFGAPFSFSARQVFSPSVFGSKFFPGKPFHEKSGCLARFALIALLSMTIYIRQSC